MMPGLLQKVAHSNSSSSWTGSCGSISIAGCASGPDRCGIDPFQLQEFWDELSLHARRELLQVDKHTLFEQVRKNLYCSRCSGLLLEGFSQIIYQSKNLHGGSSNQGRHNSWSDVDFHEGSDCVIANDVRDPSVHPWGGLTAMRDNTLTLLECFYDDQPLDVLQNVFNCAHARERERALLYPDACGGEGRGWISQRNSSTTFGRGYSLKETCALHTARLSCEALVDFWSALGEETRKSLLRMKEEDFVARLLFRFDSKRFCQDCRRNVLREFKELKEQKRNRKQSRCTKWFCTADTAFFYEVSNSSVQVNWKEFFEGDAGNIYQHFEWALGSAEGSSDILGFEDVGFSGGARVDGLDLSHVSAFYITLRAWRLDGRCMEISVKAHALNGQQCVHNRLIIGDGYVSIRKGESMKQFFEHAEEVEEEEDDESTEKDGRDPESEWSRSQKHTKSPELAREFLLDAATVIFKEQVEKAFREGTARQNAHMVFVCLALGLLEKRLLVACKEISTLEKQNKLLEEEEHEKREEKQRKERKRLKEKEKKMRKKEKLKDLERNIECIQEDSNIVCDSNSRCDIEPCTVPTGKVDGFLAEMVVDVVAQSLSVDASDVQISSHVDSNSEVQQCNTCAEMEKADEIMCTRVSSGPLVSDIAERKRFKIRRAPSLEATLGSTITRKKGAANIEVRNYVRPCDLRKAKNEKASVKQHAKTYTNHDRTSQASWVQHWCFRVHAKSDCQDPHVCSNFKNSELSHKRKNTVMIKGHERKPMLISYQQVHGNGKPILNWKAVKPRSSSSSDGASIRDQQANIGTMSRSSNDEQSIKQSSHGDLPSTRPGIRNMVLSGFKREYSRTSLENMNSGSYDVAISDDGHLTVEAESSTYVAESTESSGSPSAEPEALGLKKSLQGFGPLCFETTSNDDDLSPFSEASCVTDASDGLCSDNLVTESSDMDMVYASQHTQTVSSFVNEMHDLHYSVVNPVPICEDEYFPFSASAIISHPELYLYPGHAGILVLPHALSCSYANTPISTSPKELVLKFEQELCQIESLLQFPVLSTSHFGANYCGFHWVHGQSNPAMDTEMVALSYPGVFVDGNIHCAPAADLELPNELIPLSALVQPVQPFTSFTCMPLVPSQWGDQQCIFRNHEDSDTNMGISNQFGSVCQDTRYVKELVASGNLSDRQSMEPPCGDGFSLFHFGSLAFPNEKLSPCMSLSQKTSGEDSIHPNVASRAELKAGWLKCDKPVEEYTLFAATPTKRFSFF